MFRDKTLFYNLNNFSCLKLDIFGTWQYFNKTHKKKLYCFPTDNSILHLKIKKYFGETQSDLDVI